MSHTGSSYGWTYTAPRGSGPRTSMESQVRELRWTFTAPQGSDPRILSKDSTVDIHLTKGFMSTPPMTPMERYSTPDARGLRSRISIK